MKVKKFALMASALCERARATLPIGLKALPLSLLATASLSAAVVVPGVLKYEYFPGDTRPGVESGSAVASYAGTQVGSDLSGLVTTFEAGTNFAEGYANRISGFFTPSTTGDYVFFIAADDDSDLFLSTDDTPANKKLIAQEAGWSGVRKWNTVGGGSTVENKRSDQATISQWPGNTGAGATINLKAGTKYYIEAVHHEGGGGDNLAVTYKLAADADPADDEAPKFKTTEISASVDGGTVTVSVPPTGGTYYKGLPISMFVLDNAVTDKIPVTYQWRRNGANITGATGSTYSVSSASATDAGSYDVVLTAPGPTGAFLSVTSAPPAVVEVKDVQVELVPGKLLYEYFPGKSRTDVEGGIAGAPSFAGATIGNDKSGLIDVFESGTNFAENYANRFSGVFIPKTTGNYVFFIAADDDSDLFLSTDENSANKKLIAQEAGWSGVRKWSTVGGGSTVENKRSDQATISQWAGATGTGATINLTAGTKYYIEAVHHEGGGGDNLAVTYKLDSEADPADDDAPAFTTDVIAVNIPRLISVAAGPFTSGLFKFSVSDSGASVLDASKTKLTIDGTVVTPTAGTKAGDITPYTFSYPTALDAGSRHYYSIQATDVKGQVVTANGLFTTPVPYFPKDNLPGPAAVNDAFGVRFIYAIKDASGNLRQVTGLPTIFGMLKASGSNNFTGKIYDTTAPVVNWNSGGLIADDTPYPDAVTADSDNWNGEDFINLNIANINVAEEGDYTFGVHSDDGFALRIRGATALSVNGNGQLDAADPEAVVHPADTGDSNTRAVYHLKKGIYRLEFFWWERGGGDNGELYVAKGAFGPQDATDTWVALGDPSFTSIKLTSAAPTFPDTNPPVGDLKIASSLTGTALQLTVVGGGAGTVEGSTDLKAWTSVGAAPQTVQTTDGKFRFFRLKK